MEILTLTPYERQFWGASHKIIATYADFTGTATTVHAAQIFPASGTVPAGTQIAFKGLNLITGFDASDTSQNSATLVIGTAAAGTTFLASTELAEDGTEIDYKATSTHPYAYTNTGSVVATLTVAGGANPTCPELNAGKVELYFAIQDLNDLDRAQPAL